MINQLTILGHIGQNATVKHANGTTITKFSVATKKSWKDEHNECQEKTQWHQVVCFGGTFEAISNRLVKGALVYVQGQLATHEYDRTIKVPAGKKFIEHIIKQLVVELKADTIRIADRSVNTEYDAVEPESSEAP